MTLKDITPESLKCDFGACPAIFALEEVAPEALGCRPTVPMCPAIFKSKGGAYVIVGKLVDASTYQELDGRIGDGEVAIEVPKELIDRHKKGA
jgi:hypothetical protein